MDQYLLNKYNVPGPRYTSYPTVPYWDTKPVSESDWKDLAKQTFTETNREHGISLYIHLPFCEKLCTYCGCNTRITINHQVERVYMEAVLKEWQLYTSFLQDRPHIREIHLGGGTPTFFSPANLQELICKILDKAEVPLQHEFAFEAHPGNTTDEHLQALYDCGFRRISIGVQDFNPEVLKIINRHQTYNQVRHLTEQAREIGFSSVNYDLVYGLPLQNPEMMYETIEKVAGLQPDRIALYSYAHVPWLKPGQRKFTEQDLPDASLKLALYYTCREYLSLSGYEDIGMDHFSLKSDPLYYASRYGGLHRNFMGYTTQHTPLLIGLGASAISDSQGAYIQNEKTVEAYYKSLKAGNLPIFRGHILTEEDKILRKHIQQLMCSFETDWIEEEDQCEAVYAAVERLEELVSDGLVDILRGRVRVTARGRAFVRNICMAFDERMWCGVAERRLFSQAV